MITKVEYFFIGLVGSEMCIRDSGGNAVGAATMENSMEFPQKIKNRTAFWPSLPSSSNISKEAPNTNLKEYVHPYVLCSIIYNNQDLKAAQVHISR